MKIKLLKDIIGEIAGKQAVDIVDLLIGKKNVNEFLIAKKLKLTINQTRNILYKLSDASLVSFIRKKDKRKGWYTYFWTLNIEKTFVFLRNVIIQNINNTERQLKSRGTKRFYICKTCHVEISEENALLHNFICPECEQVYELSKDKKLERELSRRIPNLRKELSFIEEELEKEKVVRDRRQKRKDAKEKREKLAKRRKRKLKKKKEMKKKPKKKKKKLKRKRKKKKKVKKKKSKRKNKKLRRKRKKKIVRKAKKKKVKKKVKKKSKKKIKTKRKLKKKQKKRKKKVKKKKKRKR